MQGTKELLLAFQLLGNPDAPGALTQARTAIRRALKVLPQPVPDPTQHS
ncbi:hypothetical protein GZL_00969 [Streptomyces sp. 769]|nr:hypothetical protein GZL_00969 [Streptomyces sp. 769]